MNDLKRIAERFGKYLDIQVTGPLDFEPWEVPLRLAGFMKLKRAGLEPIMRVVTDDFLMGGDRLNNKESIEATLKFIIENNLRPDEVMDTPLHWDWMRMTKATPDNIQKLSQRFMDWYHVDATTADTMARNAITWNRVFKQKSKDKTLSKHDPRRHIGHQQVGLTYETLEKLGVSKKITDELRRRGFVYPMEREGVQMTGVFPLKCCKTGQCISCQNCSKIVAQFGIYGDTFDAARAARINREMHKYGPNQAAAIMSRGRKARK